MATLKSSDVSCHRSFADIGRGLVSSIFVKGLCEEVFNVISEDGVFSRFSFLAPSRRKQCGKAFVAKAL